MSKIINKKEFNRVREQIQEEGLANVTVYHKENFADPSVAAYARLTDKPPTIQILKGSKVSYKDLLINMLHEVGHIVDYTVYKNSKRIETALKYDYNQDTVKNTIKFPRYAKFSILRWESIADNYIEILLKKYKVKPRLVTSRDLKHNAAFDFYSVLNELLTGKLTTKKQRRLLNEWLESKKIIPEITTKFIKKSLSNPSFPKNFNKIP